MTVKAWLEGHQFDLQDLTELLADGEVRVVHDVDEDAYYLTAPEIDNPPQAGRFDIPAKALLDRINGLGRAKNPEFRRVKLASRYTDPTGKHIHVGAAAAEIRIRGHATAVVIGPEGQPKPSPPSPWPDRFALTATNTDVGELLDIIGSPERLEWDELTKAFEIIRESVRPDTVVTLGWSTAADLDSFRESANRKDVSGPTARHARRPGRPQHRPMSIGEARSYVCGLVAKWLGSLAGNG
ncbi:hypothetical protein [Mycolicibacterium tusciae]|uniref:hypothetical protein n=1 Tax=Mycolicibacterium tusciae TaxID=75922 RepID=UPI00024A1B54|nr:hypothetical protein [Mycolicibacterium tusciae]